MFNRVLRAMVVGVGAMAATAWSADAREEVQAAVNRLADIGSYSWTTSTEGAGGMRGGAGAEGRIQKDGLAMLKLQMRDGSIDVYLRGEKAAFQSPDGDGWMSLAEAADPNAGPGPGRMVANMARNFRPPVVQAQNFAEKVEGLTKAEDGAFTGTLPEADAKSLMQRRQRGPGGGPGGPDGGPELRDAKATVKFWASDGVLSKFQYHLTGVMTFNGEEREIDRTTTVEIKDVGNVTIDVPEEAKAKME